MTVAFNDMTNAEICHKKILNAYSEMQNQNSEEDSIQNSYLTALSVEEIHYIHTFSEDVWEAIVLTAIVMQEKAC